jgi:RecA-family ATPase
LAPGPTPIYKALDKYICEWKPILKVLDVLADMFSGDENNRPQARQYVGLLKRLARKHACAFLLLAHPSLTGMNTGTGTSGSTGWNNGVRSRLYFQTAKASDGSEPTKNLRILESKKSNYSQADAVITLEWKNGRSRLNQRLTDAQSRVAIEVVRCSTTMRAAVVNMPWLIVPANTAGRTWS